MQEPEVSIVTPSFNQARFIEECLDSVSAQAAASGIRVQHLVLDNESTDGTVDILAARKDLEWFSEKDRGQSDALNKGFRLAQAEWVCWLNADDALAPGALQAFRTALQRNPSADVIYGHVQFIDEQSEPVKVTCHLPYFYFLTLYGCYIPPSSGTFFRKKLFLDNPLDENFHYVMDVEWFLRCGSRINAHLVDKVLSHFRISSTAKTSEMIQTGNVTERHAQERIMYRRMHVYSRWPELNEAQAQARLDRRHRLALLFYYLLKLRYLGRYMSQARAKQAGPATH